MLDGLSLDQLRVFVAAVEQGSFSAAGRKLNRVQSAVSDLVAKLEGHVGVSLFDRSRRQPVLTPEGAALLADARSILAGVDVLRARARGMSSGIEPELSVVIDVMVPLAAVTDVARAFRDAFPGTPLRIDVEALGGAYQRLMDRGASIGVVGPLPTASAGLTTERLTGIPIIMVAAADHPLAAYPGTVARAELARHVQLVLTDRSHLSEGRDFFVLSPLTWRVADLYAKRAFLLEGLGWGGMPRHAVAAELATGRLVALSIEDLPTEGLVRPLWIAHPSAAPPGPAGRWFVERLRVTLLQMPLGQDADVGGALRPADEHEPALP